jgi:hypothetical protein
MSGIDFNRLGCQEGDGSKASVAYLAELLVFTCVRTAVFTSTSMYINKAKKKNAKRE